MNLEEQQAVESNDGSGQEITVWVGGPILVSDLPSTGRLLVIEGEPERAKELKQKLAEQPNTQVYEEVLTAENGVKVQWHRFNDARLNGPCDLRTWQQHFPNLRQTHQEQRCGRRLGELLDNRALHETGQVIAALHINLRQGDPLAALAGLGSWINQLETVQLMLPWPKETMDVFEAYLTKLNFRQDLESATLWKRDPIATRHRLLKEKEKEKQVLLAANHLLKSECEVMQAGKESLTAEIEKISGQLHELKKNQDLTQAKIQKQDAEVKKLIIQKESLQQECQQLNSDKCLLMQKLKAEEATNLKTRKVLNNLFPVEIYRKSNIDLSDIDEDSLAIHYLEHGHQQGRLKTYHELEDALNSSLKRCEEAETKLELLETQFGLVKQQLETLKDVFARLAEKPEPPQSTIEE